MVENSHNEPNQRAELKQTKKQAKEPKTTKILVLVLSLGFGVPCK